MNLEIAGSKMSRLSVRKLASLWVWAAPVLASKLDSCSILIFLEGKREHASRVEYRYSISREDGAAGMICRPAHAARAIWPPKWPNPIPLDITNKVLRLHCGSQVFQPVRWRLHIDCKNRLIQAVCFWLGCREMVILRFFINYFGFRVIGRLDCRGHQSVLVSPVLASPVSNILRKSCRGPNYGLLIAISSLECLISSGQRWLTNNKL